MSSRTSLSTNRLISFNKNFVKYGASICHCAMKLMNCRFRIKIHIRDKCSPRKSIKIICQIVRATPAFLIASEISSSSSNSLLSNYLGTIVVPYHELSPSGSPVNLIINRCGYTMVTISWSGSRIDLDMSRRF